MASAAGSSTRITLFQYIQSFTGVRSTHHAACAAFFPNRVPQRGHISPGSTSRPHFLQYAVSAIPGLPSGAMPSVAMIIQQNRSRSKDFARKLPSIQKRTPPDGAASDKSRIIPVDHASITFSRVIFRSHFRLR